MYGEETDWCCRFKKAGWKNLFTPDAQIIHLGGQSSKKVRREMIVRLRLSVLAFIRKHHGRSYYAAACICTAMFFIVRMPACLFLSVFGGSRQMTALAKFQAYRDGTVAALKAVFQKDAA
jgi:GT2 family glycosyltransferase